MTQPPASTDDVDAAVDAAAAEHRAGRLEEAERLYAAALQAAPGHPRASYNLGMVFLARREVGRALPLLAVAASADPPTPRFVLTYAHALIAAGDLVDAEAQLRRVLVLTPDDVEAAADLGLVQLRLGRLPAARETYEQVLRLSPDHLGALMNLGSVFKALRQPEEAEACYRRALALEPGNGPALRNLGIVLVELERHAEALDCADRALAADPAQAEALLIRGNALYYLARFEEALETYRRLSQLEGQAYEALIKIGRALAALGRHAEALAALDEAVALRPEAPGACYERASVRLQTGDFDGGWRDFEARWRHEPYTAGSSGFVTPELRAQLDLTVEREGLAGRRVLLVAEQGIGDQVQFASMIPDLAEAAAAVTCVCDRRLVRLFSNSFAGVDFPAPGTAISVADFDTVLAVGGLGRIFRKQAEDFPGRAFVAPRPQVSERWAQRLGPRRGLRVGLSWRGGTPSTRTSERSLSLDALLPVLRTADCEFVSLQYGDARAEVAEANARLGTDIRVFDPADIDDYEDLAGLIETLDVVVTVQTSVAHLAGALGKACCILLPHNPHWRYGTEGPAMPWYGSVELFRTTQAADWAPVVQRVADALSSRTAAGAAGRR
jgi:tetratricopeptide (TPR) repeat protein